MSARVAKRSVFLIAAALLSGLSAQALNVNYQVRVYQVRHFTGGFLGPCDEPLEAEEYTAIISAFDDTGVGGVSNSACLTHDIDGNSTTFPDALLRIMTNSAATNITIGMLAFEDDVGSRCAFEDFGISGQDDCLLNNPTLVSIPFRNGSTNVTLYGPFGDGSHDVVVSIKWNYVIPNGYTEQFFTGMDDVDLSFKTVTFTPDASAESYTACIQPASQFITDPAGGTVLPLGDDAFIDVTSAMGQVKLFDTSYSNFFVGSNGYITFGQGDTFIEESTNSHFNLPRVSALFDDFFPSIGDVTWRDLPDRVAVTWLNVQEYTNDTFSSFQAELFFDGRIRITWLDLAATDGLVGLSAGLYAGYGVPSPFVETDVSALTACPRFNATPLSPVHATVNVPASSSVLVNFSENTLPASFSSASYKVWGKQSGFYAGAFEFPVSFAGDFNPTADFKPGEEIFVMLNSDILSSGGLLLNPRQWQFTIAASGCTNSVFYESGQSLGYPKTYAVALGDVDGDSDLDLAVGYTDFLSSRLYTNNGAGLFTDSGQSLGSHLARSLAFGDVNDDGDLDLILGAVAAGGRVLTNNSFGVFADSGQSLGGDSYAVALGDVDGDNDLDLVVGTSADEPDLVFFNNGSGVFTDSGQTLGANDARSVALGDLDGDGDLDLVIGNDSSQPNQIYTNNGAGVFSDSGQALGSDDTWSVALGDVDGDNDLDLVAGNYFGASRVYVNNGTGLVTDSGQTLGASEATLAVALCDVDGDGDLDVVKANYNGGAERVFRNDGLGVFANSGMALGGDNSTSLALGDVDGDGDLDFVVGNDSFATNRLYINVSCPDAGDDDADGIPTPVEIANGLNPANPADAAADDDTDGQSVLEEYIAGTQWTNGSSFFGIYRTLVATNSLSPAFQVNVVSGRVYSFESKNNLLSPAAWNFLGSELQTNTGTITYDFNDGALHTQRSYRVKVNLPPP